MSASDPGSKINQIPILCTSSSCVDFRLQDYESEAEIEMVTSHWSPRGFDLIWNRPFVKQDGSAKGSRPFHGESVSGDDEAIHNCQCNFWESMIVFFSLKRNGNSR